MIGPTYTFGMGAPTRGFKVSIALVLLVLICPFILGQGVPDGERTIVKRIEPRYPALAQQMNIKGSVKLDVTVLPDGNVKSISVKGGHPLLAQAAQDAIRQWRWQPSAHESVESVEVRSNPQ
jgi:TonB family protein